MQQREMRYFKLFGLLLLLSPLQMQPTLSADDDKGYDSGAVRWYADTFNVTRQTARHRLQLQDEIDVFNGIIRTQAAAIFGGLAIHHTPTYKIIVQITEGSKDGILKYVQNREIADLIEIEYVANTFVSLEAEQAALTEIGKTIGYPIPSSINESTNRVEAFVPNKTTLIHALAANQTHLPKNVVVFERALPQPENV